jgi:hypothetical protein
MNRETRTGLACAAVVIATIAAVAAVFAAGVIAQPDRVVVAYDRSAQP